MPELLKPIYNWRPLLGAVSLFVIGVAPLTSVYNDNLRVLPISMITAIPALHGLGERGTWIGGGIGASIAPILFLFATAYIAKKRNLFPKLSVLLFLIVACASFLWIGFGWKPTVEAASLTRALAISGQAVLPPVFLGFVVALVRSSITASGPWQLTGSRLHGSPGARFPGAASFYS
jgi:hypothetical protein